MILHPQEIIGSHIAQTSKLPGGKNEIQTIDYGYGAFHYFIAFQHFHRIGCETAIFIGLERDSNIAQIYIFL